MSLNISDFNLFFIRQLQPLWKKVTPSFPANPPLKSWGPIRLTLFENLVEGSLPHPPPPSLLQKWGRVHTMQKELIKKHFKNFLFQRSYFERLSINGIMKANKTKSSCKQIVNQVTARNAIVCLPLCFFYCVSHKNALSYKFGKIFWNFTRVTLIFIACLLTSVVI